MFEHVVLGLLVWWGVCMAYRANSDAKARRDAARFRGAWPKSPPFNGE